MTSIPASRSARAMIFAPRSWPSRPGFATTTLIFPATVRQYRNVKLTVVGCSPAWPNPGRAHSGYLLSHDGGRLLVDCGPGVLSRLREAEDWPRVDAIAITHTCTSTTTATSRRGSGDNCTCLRPAPGR